MKNFHAQLDNTAYVKIYTMVCESDRLTKILIVDTKN